MKVQVRGATGKLGLKTTNRIHTDEKNRAAFLFGACIVVLYLG